MTNWTPVATGVGTIVGALIAGWFGGRNARKTPHDRLKALVEISRDLPPGVDVDGAVEGAMRRELRHLDRLNKAREESLLKYWWQVGWPHISTVGRAMIRTCG
ncbi:hypothetical protein [Mycolicibacterium palauense]|uniref:hypothetical protein n=1 Tax=Mycolicibacterium palauense TaxID=2034511 RepID=UPI0011459C10|nr:hypothetical protein [Mycolicibacterium palauense]